MKTEIISEILDALWQIRTKIFEEADVNAVCWLYEGLNQICSDLAMMKAAWLPENPEGLPGAEPVFEIELGDSELEVEQPLEMQESEPAQPKTDFTEAKGGPGHETS